MNKQAKGIINVEQYNTLDSTKRSNIFSPCFLSLLRPKVALIISLCLHAVMAIRSIDVKFVVKESTKPP